MRETLSIGNLLLGLLYISIAVAVLVAAMLAVPAKNPNQPKVILGGQGVFVMIADTQTLQEHGLSGWEKLEPDHGMLFVFAEPQRHGFWMKDMLFPIDIIWFDSNREVVDVWENATPESYPKIFTPRVSSQFVLEVPAGFFAEHNLKIGNVIEILK